MYRADAEMHPWPSSVWVEVKIFDPDPEGIGEIAVKGPNIMKGIT